MSGAPVSKGIAGGEGAEADCGRDCYTWRLVCGNDGQAAPSSSRNSASAVAARLQPAEHLILHARYWPPVVQAESTQEFEV